MIGLISIQFLIIIIIIIYQVAHLLSLMSAGLRVCGLDGGCSKSLYFSSDNIVSSFAPAPYPLIELNCRVQGVISQMRSQIFSYPFSSFALYLPHFPSPDLNSLGLSANMHR